MASTATVTAVTGPAITCTAGVFTNVTDLDFQIAAGTLTFTSNGRIYCFALTGSNTITITASDGSYTISVS